MEPLMYDEFCKREKNDWWFVGRRKIILIFLKKHLKKRNDLKIVDIGCGAGGIVDLLGQYGNVTGVDKDKRIVNYNKKQGRNVYCGSLDKLKFPKESFDLITLLEVLEHVDDDINGLKEINRILKPKGLFYLSVPVFPFLWSSHDYASHHKRRYTKKELLDKLSKSGFKVMNTTYFDSFLFPIIVAYRFWTNIFGKEKYKSNFINYPPIINAFLKIVFGSESFFLKHFNFPIGVSLLVVARKK
jgi:SAM-dependent methyltransferase